MNFGSVCSGIEAASVAWNPLGWHAAWVAEIEPAPSALLAHHYSDVPNLGDMTKIAAQLELDTLEAPDVLCGGTPCQAFSVAGLRKSLDDARGNLSLVFCEIANALDNSRLFNLEQPAIIFWENVPGVLSTKDNAFGCFLAGLAGEDDPLVAPGGKWPNAGAVYGPQRTVAWRVLDAQYFGVAQRRRRVFVVASARDGFDPAEVLFEFDGLRRDTAPSRETREAVAGTIEASLGRSRGAGTPPAGVTTHRMVAFGEYSDDGTASAMKARDYKDATDLVALALPFDTTQITSPLNFSNPQAGDLCHPLAAGAHIPAIAISFGAQMSVPQVDFDLNQTLQAKNPMAVAIRTAQTGSNGCGINEDGVAYTLDSAQGQAVACGAFKPGQSASARSIGYEEEMAPALEAGGGGNNKPAVHFGMQVRRLTPVECERLQGFPDNYTLVPNRGKPMADGPRYKALGNSWAVPVVRWIGERIQKEAQKVSA